MRLHRDRHRQGTARDKEKHNVSATIFAYRGLREKEEMEKWSYQRIRELMTRIALRGMAANEIGCARISMMVRSTSSKRGLIHWCKTVRLQPHRFLLQRTAGPYIGVIATKLSREWSFRSPFTSGSTRRIWSFGVLHAKVFRRGAFKSG